MTGPLDGPRHDAGQGGDADQAALYAAIEVDRDLAFDVEQLGNKRKYWFTPHDEEDVRLLFKADERVAGGTDKLGLGEDWAEKIACEICQCLGIPHVQYELAIEKRSGVKGVVCRNIARSPVTLVLGNQLMLEHDPEYPAEDGKKYGVRQHTVDAVLAAVAKLEPPPEEFCEKLPPGIESAADIYIGYVMLDALVANQDRHHQNWGALRQRETRLAPTFDHGAALARNEPDEKRHRRMYGPDRGYSVENFIAKARSSFYSEATAKRPLRTLEAFQEFAARKPAAAQSWLTRLHEFSDDDARGIIRRIPADRMSAVTREFTLRLIQANQRRLLIE